MDKKLSIGFGIVLELEKRYRSEDAHLATFPCLLLSHLHRNENSIAIVGKIANGRGKFST